MKRAAKFTREKEKKAKIKSEKERNKVTYFIKCVAPFLCVRKSTFQAKL